MQINPGGRLNTEDVIGRDDEIARYWRVIERQGLVISAERRIGKTHIVLKMRDECRSGYLPFYQDLEAVHTTPELIRSIYNTVRQSLDRMPRFKAEFAKWSALLPGKIGGVDLPTGPAASQALLADAFDDLITIASPWTGCLASRPSSPSGPRCCPARSAAWTCQPALPPRRPSSPMHSTT